MTLYAAASDGCLILKVDGSGVGSGCEKTGDDSRLPATGGDPCGLSPVATGVVRLRLAKMIVPIVLRIDYGRGESRVQ